MPVDYALPPMHTNSWLEKAERLRAYLAHRRDLNLSGDMESAEREAIAHWLRAEFSDQPPEDTATLPLFLGSNP